MPTEIENRKRGTRKRSKWCKFKEILQVLFFLYKLSYGESDFIEAIFIREAKPCKIVPLKPAFV